MLTRTVPHKFDDVIVWGFPDAKNDFGELRHKSNYFLKSLCISIENQFPDVDLPNKYSEKFEEKFASYIDKLGTLKKKIIFIIDGLDHVHRDTSLNENSLLNQMVMFGINVEMLYL